MDRGKLILLGWILVFLFSAFVEASIKHITLTATNLKSSLQDTRFGKDLRDPRNVVEDTLSMLDNQLLPPMTVTEAVNKLREGVSGRQVVTHRFIFDKKNGVFFLFAHENTFKLKMIVDLVKGADFEVELKTRRYVVLFKTKKPTNMSYRVVDKGEVYEIPIATTKSVDLKKSGHVSTREFLGFRQELGVLAGGNEASFQDVLGFVSSLVHKSDIPQKDKADFDSYVEFDKQLLEEMSKMTTPPSVVRQSVLMAKN
jgi:hypothetical protein